MYFLGCILSVTPIDTVYGTLDLVDAKLTKQYSEKSEVKEEIEADGTYTMFAPSDDAWETLDPVSLHSNYHFFDQEYLHAAFI